MERNYYVITIHSLLTEHGMYLLASIHVLIDRCFMSDTFYPFAVVFCYYCTFHCGL